MWNLHGIDRTNRHTKAWMCDDQDTEEDVLMQPLQGFKKKQKKNCRHCKGFDHGVHLDRIIEIIF